MTAIRKYRTDRKLTQAELAAVLGVSQAAIAMWENGDRKPDIIMLKKLSDALGCTADELLAPVIEDQQALA